MTGMPAPLGCTGRAVDDQLRPVADACGDQFEALPALPEGCEWLVPGARTDPDRAHRPLRTPTAVEQDNQARGAGWSVHVRPDGSRAAACPKCRKPNAEVVADCRAIQQDLLTREPDRPADNT